MEVYKQIMKTIAQQLNVKEFPFFARNSKGNEIYYENSEGLVKDYRKIPEYTKEELVKKIGNFKLKIK